MVTHFEFNKMKISHRQKFRVITEKAIIAPEGVKMNMKVISKSWKSVILFIKQLTAVGEDAACQNPVEEDCSIC